MHNNVCEVDMREVVSFWTRCLCVCLPSGFPFPSGSKIKKAKSETNLQLSPFCKKQVRSSVCAKQMQSQIYYQSKSIWANWQPLRELAVSLNAN